MKKLKRIGCVCGVLALVGVAYGATRLEFDFCPPEGSPICGNNVTGMAVLNYVQGTDETILQVILSGLQSGDFTLTVVDCGVTFSFFGDDTGAITLHEVLAGDCSGSDLELRGGFNELLGVAVND